MKFTNKAKAHFEKWYFENHCTSNIEYDELLKHQYSDMFNLFYELKFGFQIGVYLQWLDSIGIYINEIFFHSDINNPKWAWNLEMDDNLLSDRIEYNSRQLMYRSVFKYIDIELEKKYSNIQRFFKVDDWVVYKPYENCSKVDISGKGKIIEDLGNGMYLVTFGYRSMYGIRTGKYCWVNLYPTDDSNALILQN